MLHSNEPRYLFELVWYDLLSLFHASSSHSQSPAPPSLHPLTHTLTDDLRGGRVFCSETATAKHCDVHRGPLVSDRVPFVLVPSCNTHTHTRARVYTENQFGSTMARQKPHVSTTPRGGPRRSGCCILHVTSIASVCCFVLLASLQASSGSIGMCRVGIMFLARVSGQWHRSGSREKPDRGLGLSIANGLNVRRVRSIPLFVN